MNRRYRDANLDSMRASMVTLLADRTAIIIAHRLSTVEIADRVLVLDDRRVVEDGPPATLLRGNGHSRALHAAWMDSLAH